MKKFIVISVAFIIILSAFLGFSLGVVSKFALFDLFLSLSPVTPLFPETNILILGVDNAFGHRSDTIMVLHTNPEDKSASLLSIPRDTLAIIPGRGLDKINHAFAYGGTSLSLQTVEELLGINIPYYIVVNLSGISNLIDEVGGITIDVKKRMCYIDYAGGLYIDLSPGVQKLTGKEVMGYLRYRSDGGDFSRINRQQNFLNALANEMLRGKNRFKSPKLFLTLLSYLDTNLNSKDTIGLCLGLRAAHKAGQVHMGTLPGRDMIVDGIYYWKADKDKLEEIVRAQFYDKKIGLLSAAPTHRHETGWRKTN